MGKHTGKIFGGIAGFLLGGGPIGLILGVLAGKYFDDNMMVEDGSDRYYNPQFVFWAGVSVLAAKISKADGAVSQQEISVFEQFLNQKGVDSSTKKTCAEIFNQSKNTPDGYQSYARDIYKIWYHDRQVLGEIFIMLVNIAMADNYMHPNEERILHGIAAEFGFNRYDYERLMAYVKPENPNRIYEVLGVQKSDSLETIKKRYRQLVKENHPDKLQSRGVPQSVIDDAKKRMQEINAAYDQIVKQHSN
ncbi:MAG: TerB family tellurite resistance protein [Calditrichaeota bacterium]|nr:TerB family tellurite resistance protein [Calditrichota bacterium]